MSAMGRRQTVGARLRAACNLERADSVRRLLARSVVDGATQQAPQADRHSITRAVSCGVRLSPR